MTTYLVHEYGLCIDNEDNVIEMSLKEMSEGNRLRWAEYVPNWQKLSNKKWKKAFLQAFMKKHRHEYEYRDALYHLMQEGIITTRSGEMLFTVAGMDRYETKKQILERTAGVATDKLLTRGDNEGAKQLIKELVINHWTVPQAAEFLVQVGDAYMVEVTE